MGTGNRDDSLVGGKFVVEIDGVNVGNFKEVGGLDSRTGVIVDVGGKDKTARKIPGKTEYQNIVLKRGYTGSDELWKWRKTVLDGKVERKSGSIVLMGEDNESEKLRYNFYEGWPVKWEGPSLSGGGSDTMVETLEITHEKVERA
jgi:phage tail-like protein